MAKKYKLFDPFCDFDLIFTAAITGEKLSNILFTINQEFTGKHKYLDLGMDLS